MNLLPYILYPLPLILMTVASLELAASLFKAIPAVFGLLAAADVRDSKQTEQLMASCNASVKAIYACSWLRAVAYAVMTSMHAVEGLA
jgi:hypothetical protein